MRQEQARPARVMQGAYRSLGSELALSSKKGQKSCSGCHCVPSCVCVCVRVCVLLSVKVSYNYGMINNLPTYLPASKFHDPKSA